MRNESRDAEREVAQDAAISNLGQRLSAIEEKQRLDRDDAPEDSPGRGRPATLDTLTKARVAGMITAGISQRTVADFLNIHPSTISKAIKRDEAFRRDIVQAQAAAKVLPILKIKKASETSWRAAAWMLHNAQPTTDLTERAAKKQRKRDKRKFERDAAKFLSNMGEHLDQPEDSMASLRQEATEE